jgi:hypothetical protein
LAQKPPKIDSLLIRLAKPKAEAMDLVLMAFMSAGLSVSDQTASLVTSDQGTNDNALLNIRFKRIVRALVLGRDSSTIVLITGDEVRMDKDDKNREFKHLRIDNYAGGAGNRVWLKMVAAAMALDSTQVPEVVLGRRVVIP